MAIQVKEKEFFTKEMLDYLERTKKVLDDVFLPYRVMLNNTPWLQLRETHPDLIKKLFSTIRDQKLLGTVVPKEYGGMGLNCLQDGLLTSEKIKLAKSGFWDATLAPSGNFAVQTLRWSKYPEVKDKYMKDLTKGGMLSFYLTDPEAGVDSGSMRTTAVKDGDYYVINGPKWWMCSTTEGFWGKNWHIIFAKTDPAKRTSGISAFIIDHDTPGQVYGRAGDLVPQRFDPRAEITLKDLRVHKSHMLGQEGEGIKCLQDGINYNTVWYAYHGVAYAESAMAQVMEHATKSVRFGSYLYEFQGVHYPIAEMAINSEVGRAMAHKAADLRDQGDPDAVILGCIALRYAGPMAIATCTKAMELLAGRGVERGEGYSVEQLLRESFIINLFRTPNLDKRFIASHYLGKKLKAGIVM